MYAPEFVCQFPNACSFAWYEKVQVDFDSCTVLCAKDNVIKEQLLVLKQNHSNWQFAGGKW
jgi:hypothetical protein